MFPSKQIGIPFTSLGMYQASWLTSLEAFVNLRELSKDAEFLFVYLVMYSSNGYNIRNDCIHGRQYQGSADVAFAYRLTVICTYMMLKRLQGLEAIVENEVNSEDHEEIVCHGR